MLFIKNSLLLLLLVTTAHCQNASLTLDKPLKSWQVTHTNYLSGLTREERASLHKVSKACAALGISIMAGIAALFLFFEGYDSTNNIENQSACLNASIGFLSVSAISAIIQYQIGLPLKKCNRQNS